MIIVIRLLLSLRSQIRRSPDAGGAAEGAVALMVDTRKPRAGVAVTA
jgi:hypothetical protein